MPGQFGGGASQFAQTLNEIERLVADLRNDRGIVITPLNTAIEDLKRHTERVEKIEANIDAIREEVIDRIKGELEQRRETLSPTRLEFCTF
jgi:uncharacterized protein Yka (UPF0111/DUF47 family)